MINFVNISCTFSSTEGHNEFRGAGRFVKIVIVFMDSELSSRSEKRSLRNIRRRDYSKMSKGEGERVDDVISADIDPSQSQQTLEGEHLGSPSEASDLQGASGTSQGVLRPGFSMFDDDEEKDRNEMASIALEMKRLNAEESRCQRKQQLEKMRRELKEQQDRVRSMKGKGLMFAANSGDFYEQTANDDKGARPKIKLSKSDKQPSEKSTHKLKLTGKDDNSSDEPITIEDLRKNPKLQNKVKKELKKIGLTSSNLNNSSSSSSGDSSDSSSASDDDNSKKKKKHKKHKKSGINAKASDRVKNPQRWPHAHLQYEFVNRQVKFDDLDMKMFIAGEMEIISADDLSDSERKGRLNLLKKIVYYTNMYEFKGLKAFYAAWLREIELGKKSWSDDPQHIESAILSKYLLKKPGFPSSSKKDILNKNDSSEDRTWF